MFFVDPRDPRRRRRTSTTRCRRASSPTSTRRARAHGCSRSIRAGGYIGLAIGHRDRRACSGRPSDGGPPFFVMVDPGPRDRVLRLPAHRTAPRRLRRRAGARGSRPRPGSRRAVGGLRAVLAVPTLQVPVRRCRRRVRGVQRARILAAELLGAPVRSERGRGGRADGRARVSPRPMVGLLDRRRARRPLARRASERPHRARGDHPPGRVAHCSLCRSRSACSRSSCR